MKKIFSILLLIFFSFSLTTEAQTLDIKWSDSIYCTNQTGGFHNFVGGNSKYVYTMVSRLTKTYDRKTINIIVHDKETMKKIASRVIYDRADKSYEFLKNTYWRTIVLEDKMYVFWIKETKNKEREIYVQSFDCLLKAKSEIKKVYTGSNEKNDNKKYQVFVSANSISGRFVIGKFTSVKGENVAMEYHFLENNFSIISTKQVQLPIIDKTNSNDFPDFDYKLEDDGNFHIKCKVILNKAERKDLKNGENKRYTVYSIMNPASGEIKSFPIKFSDKNIMDFDYIVDQNSVKLFGLFCDLSKDKDGKDIHGYFYASIDAKTLKMVNDIKLIFFTKEHLDLLEKDYAGIFASKKEMQSEEESISSEYTIDAVQLVANNLFLFCSKTYNYTRTEQTLGANGQTRSKTVKLCRKENLTAIKINQNGIIEWISTVPRFQIYGAFDARDFNIIYDDSKFIVMYGEAYEKNVPYAVFDSETGKYEKKLYILNEDSAKKENQTTYKMNGWAHFDKYYYVYSRDWLSGFVNSDKSAIYLGRFEVVK